MITVLSLFDGLGGARIALDRLSIDCLYFASEIDKYAIQIAQKNYPDIIQLGDILKLSLDNWPQIDLLIGGSPCQGFSKAGNQLNFNDHRSRLFFKFAEILDQIKPRYFVLENVKMKKDWRDIISNFLKVEPILINSALVTAQNRTRYYWTNNPNVGQPEDKDILLKDIIENGYTLENKGLIVYGKQIYSLTECRTEEAIRKRKEYRIKTGKDYCSRRDKKLQPRTDNKSNCITAKQSREFLLFDGCEVRKLTPLECERLQGLPDNYTEGVSNTQRYKMIGNGFTIPVIEHILSYMDNGYT